MRAESSVRVLAPLIAVVLASCGAVSQRSLVAGATHSAGPTPTASTSVFAATTLAELRQRPLNLPAISAASCPATPSHDVHAVINAVKGAPNFGFGSGPVYASGFDQLYPDGFDNEVWLIDPVYTGPVIVRGQQINGQQAVLWAQPITFPESGFLPAGPAPGKPITNVEIAGETIPFYSELDLPPTSGTPGGFWRMFFGRTHLTAPGCYVFQVDGLTFSETLIFHVPDAARPPA